MTGRKLPKTPGVLIAPEPPPKPRRQGEKGGSLKRAPPAADSNFSKALLKSLKEGEEKVSFVTSCIAREFLNTDSPLLAEDLDGLNKLLESIAEDNPELVDEFLNTYFMEKSHKVYQCCWDAIIELYVGVLKISLGDSPVVYACLQALYTLSLLPNTLPVMHHLEITPVLLGVMSAYLRNPSVFTKAVFFLSQLTTVPLQDGLKIVIKENAVDILICGLTSHDYTSTIVVPILRCMSNTVSMIKKISAQAMKQSDADSRPLASVQDSLLKQSAVLEYMEKLGRDRVQTLLERFPRDLGVQVEGHRFLCLCQHKGHQVKEMRRMSAALQMLQPRSILRQDSSSPFPKRVTFVTIPLDEPEETESSDFEVEEDEEEEEEDTEEEEEDEEEKEEEEDEEEEKEERKGAEKEGEDKDIREEEEMKEKKDRDKEQEKGEEEKEIEDRKDEAEVEEESDEEEITRM